MWLNPSFPRGSGRITGKPSITDNRTFADNLGVTAFEGRSIRSRCYPREAINAFREADRLLELPIFEIQDLDRAALGTAQIGVYAVRRQCEFSWRGYNGNIRGIERFCKCPTRDIYDEELS